MDENMTADMAKMKMDLQFFADDAAQATDGDVKKDAQQDAAQPAEGDAKKDAQQEGQGGTQEPVDVQELLTRLAKAQRALDKATSEAADYKRKYKDSLSEKEKIDLDKAEAEAAKEERMAQLERQVAIHDLEKQFLAIGYSAEWAEKAAAAQYDGDTDVVIALQKQFIDARVKSEKETWLASRPQANFGIGGGTPYTKEQFDKMGVVERTKLKKEDPDAYERLLGRR